MKKSVRILLVLVAAAIFGFSASYGKGEVSKRNVEDEYFKASLTDVLNLIEYRFVITNTEEQEEVTREKLLEGAVKGMLKELGDPHTNYLAQKELEDFQEGMEGEFVGVGMVISKQVEEALLVVSPIEDTPAFNAGLKPKDKIIEIDGESVYPLTSEECQKRLRGKKGTIVKVKVYRESIDKTFDVELKRDTIILKYVKHKMLSEKVGYIRMTQFSENVSKDVRRAAEDLMSEGMEGLILDLRTNPGGALSEAVKTASLFIERGVIVSVKQARGGEEFSEREGKYLGDFPLIVLVNEGSASASEIVAGAIKDHKRGLLVGEKTFGKGSVQRIFPLPSGGAIKLTIAKYFTPSGVSIHAKGIQPDVEVKEKDDYLFFEGYLTNVDEEGVKNSKEELIEAIGEVEGEDKKEELEEKEDEQLKTAESILKGILLYQ
jgi:carboxyl-terminal processing protease